MCENMSRTERIRAVEQLLLSFRHDAEFRWHHTLERDGKPLVRLSNMLNQYIGSEKHHSVAQKLSHAARVINATLRKQGDQTHATVLSKNTTRNSQYLCMAQNVLAYMAHMLAYGVEPPKVAVTDSNGDVRLVHDNGKKTPYMKCRSNDSPAAAAATDYTVAMRNCVRENMTELCQYVLTAAMFYTNGPMAMQLRLRKLMPGYSKVDDLSDLVAEHQTRIKNMTRMNKLFIALLCELDPNVVLQLLLVVMTDTRTFVYYPCLYILRKLAGKIVPHAYPPHAVDIVLHTVLERLKETALADVCRALIAMVHNITTNTCHVPFFDNIIPRPIQLLNKFFTHARHMVPDTVAHYYITDVPLRLYTLADTPYVVFDIGDGVTVFDVTDMPTRMSWPQRLATVTRDDSVASAVVGVIEVHPINMAELLDHQLPITATQSQMHVRTCGYGSGTYFIETISPNGGGRVSSHQQHSTDTPTTALHKRSSTTRHRKVLLHDTRPVGGRRRMSSPMPAEHHDTARRRQCSMERHVKRRRMDNGDDTVLATRG